MPTAKQDLADAGGALKWAEDVIGRAAAELGPPVREPLEMIAADVERIRRRLRNAATTATGGGGGGG